MPFWGKKNQTVKILSIEDSPEMQEIMQYAIKGMGYEFLGAADGMDGIKIAEEELPAIILLDINLLSVSGLEVCLMLKQNPKTAGIPVIMCTGQSSMASVERAMSCGADGYLTKPVNMDLLKQKIQKELTKKAPGGASVKK